MKRISRGAWPTVGWGAGLAGTLAGLVVVTCALNSLHWVNRPFPGFLLWENLFVPAVGDTDWTGYRAGLPYQSRLISVDGQPVTSASQVYRIAATLPVGTPVSYTFSSGPGAAPATLRIATMRLSLPDYLLTLGNYLTLGALLTLLGFVVYLLRPEAPAAQGMLAAGATWGLYFVTAADIFGPAWFRPACLMLQALSPVALLHLALTFPVERHLLQRHPRLLPSLYVAAAGVGVVDNFVFLRSFSGMLVLNRLHAFATALSGAALVGLFVHSFIRPPSSSARQRLKIAALGAAAAFLLPIAGVALFSVLGVSFPLNFIAVPIALFPVAIGYAIVKHDLFEVDAIIRRTVAWVILTALIVAFYLAGVGALELVFAGRSGRLAQLLFLLAIVSLVNPLRNRVQTAVDFLFARDRYDYRKAVGEASQALAALLNVDAVLQRILQTIAETIHVDFGAVWLRRDGGYRLEARTGVREGASLPQCLEADSALVRRLEESPQRSFTDEEAVAETGGLAEEFAGLRAALVVPMTFERRLTGFLALGTKQSGGFYSREDLGLLRTLANQGAVAVENARSYHALLRANEELRAAQSRLIEAERLAAIGELSAAVAHGIRNPLAGIKAAAQFASLELPDDHPLHENITDILGEADKLEARIKTLLDFSKPFEPRPVPSRLEHVVADAVASLRAQMTARGIDLVMDVPPDLPDVELDYAQIEQVFLALLSNALEAMSTGGRILVSAGLREDGERVHCEVSDTGPGIPAHLLDRVFKLFFTTKSSGTGFGLAVAKKIVERHHGTIEVASEVGRGTRFTIELPLTSREPVVG